MISSEPCHGQGQRIKTDSKLIRAAIQIASKSLNDEKYDLVEIAEKVVREDGRTLSKLLDKSKKINFNRLGNLLKIGYH